MRVVCAVWMAAGLWLLGPVACSSSSAGDGGLTSGSPTTGSSSGGGLLIGSVSFTEDTITSTPVFGLGAGFVQVPAGTPRTDAGCAGQQVGSCCYLQIATTAVFDAGSSNVSPVSAGTLSLQDRGTTLVELVPGVRDAYSANSEMNSALTWAAGDSLTVSGSGAAFPAFTAAITAPHLLASISPAFSSTQSTRESTSTALTVTWSPTDTGTVLLNLQGSSASEVQAIACTVPETSGQVVVDPTLLGHFSGVGAVEVLKSVSAPLVVQGAQGFVEVTAVNVNASVAWGP